LSLGTADFDRMVPHLRTQNAKLVIEPANASACHFARFRRRSHHLPPHSRRHRESV